MSLGLPKFEFTENAIMAMDSGRTLPLPLGSGATFASYGTLTANR